MGKRRCFLGFLVSLCVFIFSANSFAEDGYTCKKEYTSCSKINYYLDNGQCRECPSGEGWESTAQEATATACTCPDNYWNSTTHETTVTAGQTCELARITITVNKNDGTGVLSGQPIAGNNDAPSVATNSGTDDVTVTCAPGTKFYFTGITRAGYTLNGFSTNQNASSGDTTITCPSSSTTLYAIWADCEVGHYCDENGDNTCPAGYTSDKNADDIHDCYRACKSGDIPHATSYTSDSRFYYGDTAPSQCKAAGCDEGYTPSGNSCATNTFNVAYANGGGTGSAPTSPTSCTYGGTCNAPSNTYTRNGYDFTGWSCTASSGQCAKSSYAAGESISTATSVNGATITLTATWSENAGNCEDGEYFDGTACVSCGNGYDHSDTPRTNRNKCYKMATPTCTQNACTNPDTTGCSAVECAASCTCSGMEQYKLYYGGTPITRTCTKAVVGLTAKPNYYTSVPGSCPLCADYDPYFNESDGGENISESDCYHTCTTEDIPYAVEFENNPIYYGSDGEWCRASLCEENYYLADGVCIDCPDNATCDGSDFDCDEGYHKNEDGTACVPDDGVIYYVCHYVQEVGKNASYNFCPKGSLAAGCTLESIIGSVEQCLNDNMPTDPTERLQWLKNNCEEKAGTTGGTITFSNEARTLPGFSYKCGYAGGIYNNTCGVCSGDPTTDVLPDGSRIVFLYYGRGKYNVNLNAGTGISSVTGAGEYDYEQLVNINATKANGYSWKNWTDNNNNNAVVSTRQSYSFNMPHKNLNYRANATVYSGYTITYDLNGGTWPTGATHPSTYSINDSFTITNPVRDNYSFTGWTITTAPTAWGNGSSSDNAKDFHVAAGTYGNFALKANWEQSSKVCIAGKQDDGTTACRKGYYCPEGTISASESCEIKCPADNGGGTVTTAATGSSNIEQCFTTRTCVPVTGGGANRVIYYQGTLADGDYVKNPITTVTYCDAGYWRATGDASGCSPVGVGAWSPARASQTTCDDENSRKQNLCSNLTGANETTTTDGEYSDSPSDCYNTCAEKPITVNGEVIGKEVPSTEKVFYNGTTIPTCTYPDNKIECEDGYEPSGGTCVPKVFTITLVHNCNNECTAVPNSPIYLKYNTGWYATYTNGNVSNPITSISQIPVRPGNTFSGYMAGPVMVVMPNGTLTANYKVVKADASIQAGWGQNDTITCEPGTYYTGTGDTCTDCPANSYCPGGDPVVQDTGIESGREDCPAANSSNYTPAQRWTGTTLVDVEPNVGSPAKSTSVAACYATVQYYDTSAHGKGSRICHYSSLGKYDSNCNDETILTCEGGYYLENPTDIFCSVAGKKHYSAQYEITREDCPGFGTEIESRLDTETETSVAVTQCMLNGIWKDTTNGGSTTRCHYFEATADYTENCDSYTIRICNAGYWDETNGAASRTMIDCVPVEDGSYSPAQSACSGEPAKPIDILGCSTKKTPCAPASAYNGNSTDLASTTPATGTRTASSESQCYLTCRSPKTENGITYTASNSPVHYNGTNYPVCEYDSDEISCRQATNGAYPLPETGATSLDQCYRNCTQSDVDANATDFTGTVKYQNVNNCTITKCKVGFYLENNTCVTCPANSYCDGINQFSCPSPYTKSDPGTSDVRYCYKDCDVVSPVAAMSGRDYNGAADTCVATRCEPGFYLQNGTCVTCPAGSYCDGNQQFSCPAGYTSAGGAKTQNECYQVCSEHDEGECHLVPVGGDKAYYPDKCQYDATINGNPASYDPNTGRCEMTGCQTGFEMINGECEPCNRENALSYEPGGSCDVESCIVGYHPINDHCEPDVEECTPDAPDSEYAEHKWIATRGAWGICEIKSCKEGFHLIANSCVADVQTCEIEHGTAQKEWNPRTGQFGPCIATSCVPGYTNDPYEKNDASKQCSECRNMYSTLGEVAASSYTTGCEIASCYYQGEKYNLDKGLNECVPICSPTPCRSLALLSGPRSAQTEYSDETGWMCWDEQTKKCKRECNPGYMSW